MASSQEVDSILLVGKSLWAPLPPLSGDSRLFPAYLERQIRRVVRVYSCIVKLAERGTAFYHRSQRSLVLGLSSHVIGQSECFHLSDSEFCFTPADRSSVLGLEGPHRCNKTVSLPVFYFTFATSFAQAVVTASDLPFSCASCSSQT